MIIKASQRAGGQNLAAHLLRLDDNEHLSIHGLRGFASDNLRDAFKEIEAISRGTKCRQYLFSVSFSPPADARVSVETFEAAIGRAEEQLGLSGQPRAIVFHEKEGRRHAHCVWSRIDANTMTARPMSFFKNKLASLSRELYLENGWKLPRGLENVAERNPANFTLDEWQQARRQGIDPRWLKQAIRSCWESADDLKAFKRSLEDRGFVLAKGDRRGFVVLDFGGEIYSLPRMLDLKAKEVRARIGDGEDLRSVDEARRTIGERMTPALRRHIAESRARFDDRAKTLSAYRNEMTALHRQARERLSIRQESEWDAETLARAARLPKGLRGLWHRLTGRYREVRQQNEHEATQTRERHADERQQLVDRQLGQRAILQKQVGELRSAQAQQLSELRSEIGRFLRFSKEDRAASRGQDIGLSLKRER